MTISEIDAVVLLGGALLTFYLLARRRSSLMVDIDTANHFVVSARGDRLQIMRPAYATLSRVEALTFAAWIVAIADCLELDNPDRPTFEQVLRAVRST